MITLSLAPLDALCDSFPTGHADAWMELEVMQWYCHISPCASFHCKTDSGDMLHAM